MNNIISKKTKSSKFAIGLICLIACLMIYLSLFGDEQTEKPQVTEEMQQELKAIQDRQENYQIKSTCPICKCGEFFKSYIDFGASPGAYHFYIDGHSPKGYTCKNCGYIALFNQSVDKANFAGDVIEEVERFSLEE